MCLMVVEKRVLFNVAEHMCMKPCKLLAIIMIAYNNYNSRILINIDFMITSSLCIMVNT